MQSFASHKVYGLVQERISRASSGRVRFHRGFQNEEVMHALQLRCYLQLFQNDALYRVSIRNADTEQEVVYERTKGRDLKTCKYYETCKKRTLFSKYTFVVVVFLFLFLFIPLFMLFICNE